MPTFSVIIPTCDRNDLLGKCLDCLLPGKQSLSIDQYEVIVTDDSKTNIARAFMKENYPWATWVEGPKRGPAANRNNGAANAQGEWLVFVDDDCLPDLGLLANYVSAINRCDQIYVFEGKIYADRKRLRLDEEAPINETGGYLWSCNFCIQKEIFLLMSGFDEEFIYAAMEDVDFAMRLKQRGTEIMFVKGAAVMHPWRRISGGEIFNKRLRAQKYFYTKYPSERKKMNLRYMFTSLLVTYSENVQFILKGKFDGISIFIFRIFFIFRLYIIARF